MRAPGTRSERIALSLDLVVAVSQPQAEITALFFAQLIEAIM